MSHPMSDPVAGPTPANARPPGALPAILVVLALGLALTLLANAWVGLAALAFGLVFLLRPFEPLVATLLAAGAASFAAYGAPDIQRDLAIVAALTAYALASFAVAWRQRRWRMPSSPFTVALHGLALTTLIGVVHGLAVRNPIRFQGLEVFPLASLGFAIVIGGLRLRPLDLRIAAWGLAAIGLASAAAGFHFFGSTGIRTGGMAFSPVPGLVALLFLSLALHDPAPRPRLLNVLVFCALIGHQVVTFTRGYWLALLVGIPLVCAMYVRRGAGAGRRWSKVVATLGLALLVLLLAVALAATRPPWNELVSLLGERFASSFTTRNTPETVSNVARLVEIRTSLTAIFQSPVLGLGHGSTLLVRQFFHPEGGPQWYIHQGYVMMWLKQGVIGLLALLWVLFAAFRMGLRGAPHAEGERAAWSSAAAASVVFVTIVGLTNYFFFNVNQSFVLAFIWGVALAASEPPHARLVWRAPRQSPVAER